MFSKASNVSMNETEILNASGDVTINHNHFYLPQVVTTSETLSTSTNTRIVSR